MAPHIDQAETLSGAALISQSPAPGFARHPADLEVSESNELESLLEAGRMIIAGTGKQTDGIVSRYFNRPISRYISGTLLRMPQMKPVYATLAAGLIGTIMALCLVFGAEVGLLAGAALFQAASIIDGVDGEIARATFRSSWSGAMLDSMVDAATNFAFIGGVAVNLWLAGDRQVAMAGAAGLAAFALGTMLLGLRAKAEAGPITFDAVKNQFQARPSRLKQILAWITMRDFMAAAGAIAIFSGIAAEALILFAVVTAGWLMVVLIVLFKTGANKP